MGFFHEDNEDCLILIGKRRRGYERSFYFFVFPDEFVNLDCSCDCFDVLAHKSQVNGLRIRIEDSDKDA